MSKKENKYIVLSVVCMLTFSACSTDEGLSASEDQDKTPIELSAGVVVESPATQRATTRAAVTSSTTGTSLNKSTSVYMVLKSENSANTADAPLYTRTIGYLQGSSSSDIIYASAYNRFWEDSYSRDSKLSAYAACVPGYYLVASASGTIDGTVDATTWTVGGSSEYKNEWSSDNGTTTLKWPLRDASASDQTHDFVNSQDLCFSNNVSDLGTEDKRLTFSITAKKFDSGTLVFYHALTRITFKIKKGEGFTADDKFEFSNASENIVIKGVNTKGTFNFTEGEFQSNIGTGDIKQFAVTKDIDGCAYVLDGLLIPGSDLDDETSGTINFTIDNNLYKLSKKTLMNALENQKLSDKATTALDNGKMRPGVHYVFTMTVGKKKMESFTAAVVDWETVTAEETTPTNARILLTLQQNGTQKKGDADFDLYRSRNESTTIDDNFESYAWTTGYTPTENKAQLIENSSGTGVYSAQDAESPHAAWYWPDNKTFYHFRSVMPKASNVTEDKTNGDYIGLAAGVTYTDVCWGAPFVSTTDKLTYDNQSKGFDGTGATHQLIKAVGPTHSTVNMIMFHMMSDVTVNLTTSEGTDKVDLTNAKMELSNIYAEGKVLMGNGLALPTGTAGTINNEISSGTNQIPWHYGFIPQSLEKVVLTITTIDNNQYVVSMKDVLATTVGDNVIANPYTKNSNGKYAINRWLPNYMYTYTFKLTKTGITKISASLADWQSVEVDETVQIK